MVMIGSLNNWSGLRAGIAAKQDLYIWSKDVHEVTNKRSYRIDMNMGTTSGSAAVIHALQNGSCNPFYSGLEGDSNLQCTFCPLFSVSSQYSHPGVSYFTSAKGAFLDSFHRACKPPRVLTFRHSQKAKKLTTYISSYSHSSTRLGVYTNWIRESWWNQSNPYMEICLGTELIISSTEIIWTKSTIIHYSWGK